MTGPTSCPYCAPDERCAEHVGTTGLGQPEQSPNTRAVYLVDGASYALDVTKTTDKENTMTTSINLTPGSLELFTALVEDAPNWSGSPLVTVTPAGRGHLTHLKKLGLLDTFEDEGCAFAVFTEAGKALAAELNLDGADYLDFV